jgi:hypothetical protein
MSEAVRERLLSVVEREDSRLAHLPAAETKHWVPRHKAAVVAAVRAGTLSLPEACERYKLTEEEFYSWMDAIDHDGIAGLRTSMRAERRKAVRYVISEPGVAMLNEAHGVDCMITDISDRGARIQFEHPVPLPARFELRCPRTGRSWVTELIWSRGEVAGVRFSNPLPAPWIIKSGLAAWFLGERRTVAIDK